MSGLRKATLATLSTREWTVEGQLLTGAEVLALYGALGSANPSAQFHAVGETHASGRRFDRAIHILKRAGLVEFKQNEWRRTGETVSEEGS